MRQLQWKKATKSKQVLHLKQDKNNLKVTFQEDKQACFKSPILKYRCKKYQLSWQILFSTKNARNFLLLMKKICKMHLTGKLLLT